MEPRKTGHGSSFFLLIRTLTAPLLVTLRGMERINKMFTK